MTVLDAGSVPGVLDVLGVLPSRSALAAADSSLDTLPSRAAVHAASAVESLAAGPGTLAVSVPGLVDHDADRVLPLASAGKLLLLTEAARQIGSGMLDAAEPVDLADEDYCRGSGILTGLSARCWTIGELALLTASVSDNTATNALLRRIPEHAPTFAVGTARELAGLAHRIGDPSAPDAPWARIVLGWLAANTDRSMVPALIPHDPEDDRVPDGLLPVGAPVCWLANKTGTDAGIRADVGVVVGAARRVGYAVLTTCEAGREFGMLHVMRQVGPTIAGFASRV